MIKSIVVSLILIACDLPLASAVLWKPDKTGSMKLRRGWRFLPGKFLKPGEALPAVGVRDMPVPGIWSLLDGVQNDGFGSYRLRVQGVSAGGRLGLRIPYIASACRIYIGTNLVFSAGSPGTSESSTVLSWRTGLIDIGRVDPSGEVIFTIHVANFGYYKGGFHEAPGLGPYRQLLKERSRSGNMLFFLLGSLFIMGVYHLMLFLLRRGDRSPLYFGLFCLLIGLRALASGSNPIYSLVPGLPFGLLYTLYMFSQVGAIYVFIKYLESLFPEEVHPFFMNLAGYLFYVSAIFTVLAPVRLLSRSGIVFDLLTALTFCYCVLVFGVALERKREGAGWIGLGFLLMIITTVHDMLLEYGVIDSILLLPLGVFLLVFTQSVLLSRRFSRSFRDVEFLSRSLERKVAIRTEELQQERDRLSERNSLMEKELDLARQIQDRLIPGSRPIENIDFFYKPMAQVGGDFFDFIKYSDGSLGIMLSDVSGHGVPAAFVTSMIKSFLLQHAKGFRSPSQLLYGLNDFLMPLTGGNFVTAFFGILHGSGRKFSYANAGHNLPLLIHKGGISIFDRSGKGIPLSIMKNRELRTLDKGYMDNDVTLPAGGKLFLYTDGLVEAIPAGGRGSGEDFWEYSYERCRLDEMLRSLEGVSCGDAITRIYEDLVRFRGNAEFDDDVCMICIDVV